MVGSEPVRAHPATLVALAIFTLVSLGLGVVANRVASKKAGFLQKYFLGNRSLGALAVALTAAVMSGGTFMGFPSLVYSFGWVVGLWIASYMVAPLTVLGVLGKRIGQLSRKTGAITLPDLLRERFGSPTLGLLTSLLVVFFLTCNLIPQFKAGGVIMKIVMPSAAYTWASGEDLAVDVDLGYVVGLAIFTATVVAYTAYGGFLAAVWTDVFQSLIMAVGVVILFPMAMIASGGLEAATYKGMELAGDGFAFGPGAGRDFHPLTLALSFFVMWAITGMGQPSTMVRLMAFRDSRTLRWSILYLTIYNILIYVPLIFIFVASRSILPGLEKPDEVMPRLVIHLANPYVAGLILAAPYGAVMSTVSGFLLIVASGLVRDVYQRFIRPSADGAGDRSGELRRDGRDRPARGGRGAQPAEVSPVDRRVRQLGDGLGLPDARAAGCVLATDDGRRGDRGDGRRRGRDAGALRLRVVPGVPRGRPGDRAEAAGLRGLLPARVRALRLGPAHVARGRRRRQPGDPAARPGPGCPALRPPASRCPGPGVARPPSRPRLGIGPGITSRSVEQVEGATRFGTPNPCRRGGPLARVRSTEPRGTRRIDDERCAMNERVREGSRSSGRALGPS